MKKWIWIWLLVLACAAPTEYQRGTAAAPMRPPSATPAGAGAPTVGQPGMRPDAIPRSPYRRILPQDEKTRREPRIWAAEPPRASEIDPDGDYFIFPVPAPPNATKLELRHATNCALTSGRFVAYAIHQDAARIKARLDSWGTAQTNCAVAKVFQACMGLAYRHNEAIRKEQATKKQKVSESLERLEAVGNVYAQKHCRNITLIDDAETIRNRAVILLGNWYRTFGGPAR